MPTADRLRPTPFIAGLAGATYTILIGIWLITAPFAVGYQPDGADWVAATIIGIATGAGVILLGLATLLTVARALRAEVRRRGLAPNVQTVAGTLRAGVRRHVPAPNVQTEPNDSDADVDDDTPHTPQPGDLDTVLATLAAALLEDIRNGHHDQTPNGTPSLQAATFPPAQHPSI